MCANRLRVFFALAAVALPGAVAAQSPVARDTAIMLKGRVVSEDDILSFPLEVVVFAGKLLVREWWPDPWFHLIDPAGPILSSFGRRGDGPGDVNFLHGMTRAPSGEGGALWVTDGGRRFKRFAMEDGRPRVTEVIDLAFPGAVARHLLQVGDSAFLAVTGQLDGPSKHDRRFVRIDRRGRFIADVGPPMRGDSVVPLADRSKMDVGKAHLNPSGTRIAVAYPFRSIVEIYDTSGRKLATALPPSPADRFENQFKKPAFPTDPWFHTGDPEFLHLRLFLGPPRGRTIRTPQVLRGSNPCLRLDRPAGEGPAVRSNHAALVGGGRPGNDALLQPLAPGPGRVRLRAASRVSDEAAVGG